MIPLAIARPSPVPSPPSAADATLAEQAIGNIVANAIAHTPAETRVAISADVAPTQVSIQVRDDGPGIAVGALPRIFDKFVKATQGGASAADGGEGTGLGLAIAKGIMDAHGGSIAAESPIANGRGTRMTMVFHREPSPRESSP